MKRLLCLLLLLCGSAHAQMFGGIMTSQSRSAASVGAAQVLCQSAVAVSAPADTTEDILHTCTIPAMGANSRIRVTLVWTVNNTADAKTTRVRLGGIGGTAFLSRNLPNVAADYRMVTIANRNSVSSQISPGSASGTSGWGTGTGANTSGAINTGVSTTLVVTCQKATAGDTCTLEDVLVELMYGA